jgi:hypothetical protein
MHLLGKDVEWTKIHMPLALVKQVTCPQGCNPCLEEDLYMKQLILDHGINMVRGGAYSEVDLTIRK